MSGVAYIDKKRLEPEALEKWVEENVPLYFDYGGKAVSYTWNPKAIAEDLLDYLRGNDWQRVEVEK